jgi:hypothetical protein
MYSLYTLYAAFLPWVSDQGLRVKKVMPYIATYCFSMVIPEQITLEFPYLVCSFIGLLKVLIMFLY